MTSTKDAVLRRTTRSCPSVARPGAARNGDPLYGYYTLGSSRPQAARRLQRSWAARTRAKVPRPPSSPRQPATRSSANSCSARDDASALAWLVGVGSGRFRLRSRFDHRGIAVRATDYNCPMARCPIQSHRGALCCRSMSAGCRSERHCEGAYVSCSPVLATTGFPFIECSTGGAVRCFTIGLEFRRLDPAAQSGRKRTSGLVRNPRTSERSQSAMAPGGGTADHEDMLRSFRRREGLVSPHLVRLEAVRTRNLDRSYGLRQTLLASPTRASTAGSMCDVATWVFLPFDGPGSVAR